MQAVSQKETDLFKRFINLNTAMRKAIFRPEITEEFSIGRKQLHVITVLNEKGKMNMTALAKGVGVSNQQLTKIVDILVQKDLVVRSYDPKNRRVVLVDLSKEGQDYITAMTNRVVDSVRSRGFKTDEKSLKRFEEHLSYLENFLAELND